MKAKEMLEKWKLEGGHKTYKELAESLGVALATLDTWKLRDEIPAKYILKMQPIQNESNSTAKIPIHYYKNVTASAGYGISVLESTPQTLELSEALLNGVKIQSYKHLDLISVAGDSMLPYFENGDKVLIERECVAKNGDTIIANIEDNLYIKRLEKDPFNKWIRLISNNSEYGSITLEGQEVEKINIIGIVRAKLSVKVY